MARLGVALLLASTRASAAFAGAQPAICGLATPQPRVSSVATSACHTPATSAVLQLDGADAQPLLLRRHPRSMEPRMVLDARLIAAATGGTFAGGLHAVTGPDHLSALLPLCIGRRWFVSMYAGAYWGLGHGLGAALVGALAFAARGALNIDSYASYMEAAVGLSIMVIGANGVREAREWSDEIRANEEAAAAEAACDRGPVNPVSSIAMMEGAPAVGERTAVISTLTTGGAARRDDTPATPSATPPLRATP